MAFFPFRLLKVIRGGKEKVITVTLVPAKDMVSTGAPGSEKLKILGIEIETISAKEKMQLHVEGGVKIKRIERGIIASNTDIREGFIITRINVIAVATTADFLRNSRIRGGAF